MARHKLNSKTGRNADIQVRIVPPHAYPKFEAFKLSKEQWNNLVDLGNLKNKNTADDTSQKFDEAINVYLQLSFSNQQEIPPAAFSKIFKKMMKLSNDLMMLSESYFFPANRKYTEPLCVNIVKGRTLKGDSQQEKPLVRYKSNSKRTGFDYNVAERNELIREQIDQIMFIASVQHNIPIVDTEVILSSINELRAVAKVASKISGPATGTHGDPYLARLIARSLTIYHGAGGRGLAAEDGAVPFMVQLMKYVAAFADEHIGEDHGSRLKASTNDRQIRETIKKARKKKELWV